MTLPWTLPFSQPELLYLSLPRFVEYNTPFTLTIIVPYALLTFISSRFNDSGTRISPRSSCRYSYIHDEISHTRLVQTFSSVPGSSSG